MLTNAVGDKDNADQDKECKRKHFNGRVSIDKLADRARSQQHDQHRNGHGGNHDPELFGHTHGGDNGVQRENDVKERNLQNRPEKVPARVSVPVRKPAASSLTWISWVLFGDEKEPTGNEGLNLSR